MTFSAIIDAKTLTSAIDSVGVLVDECKLNTGEDGVEIRAVDPANVGMVDLSINAEAFESYEAGGGVLGIDLTKLEDIVSMADSGDLVHFDLDPETRKLHIEIDSLEFTMALIDPDSIRQEPEIPDLDLNAEAVIEGKDINRSVKAADLVSDHIAFGVDEDDEVLYIDAEGDTDDVHLEFTREELIDFDVGPAHSLFSLDYLKDMNKAIPADAEVQVLLGEEFPVKLSLGFADGAGNVLYMLAPRIQSD